MWLKQKKPKRSNGSYLPGLMHMVTDDQFAMYIVIFCTK